MKKILIICFIGVLFSLLFNLPEYRELNNLIIINEIGLECDSNDLKTIYLKEIIPEKDDSGIEYKYKIHKVDGKINNKFYITSSNVITNCFSTNEFIYNNNINYNYIYHTQEDIKKELSKNT